MKKLFVAMLLAIVSTTAFAEGAVKRKVHTIAEGVVDAARCDEKKVTQVRGYSYTKVNCVILLSQTSKRVLYPVDKDYSSLVKQHVMVIDTDTDSYALMPFEVK